MTAPGVMEDKICLSDMGAQPRQEGIDMVDEGR